MKKASKIMLTVLLLLSLSSCGTGNNDNGGRAGINRLNNNAAGGNRTLRVSMEAARSVESLVEVQSALVVISNQDAYVAVRMEGSENMRAQGYETNKKNHRGENTGIFGNPGYRGYGNGTQTGDYSGTGIGGGSIDGLTIADQPERGKNFTAANNPDGNLQPESTSPAIVLDSSYSGISASFKKNIADQVAKADKHIQTVYISFNRAFYMRLNRLADDLNNGRDDVKGDFTTLVDGVFDNYYPLLPTQ
ncbi:YhcN/YlaJ family sporulation lipoprotein [Neobacillus sp. YIM B06451]|uniref:YhcN/YlaJ family sporulation lipoprotein n=1 Tax=Neobacillus sp. YIM B06451 TaxID=3070994 RepID=UPI00292E7FFE|nr:YhcN/YlaJ family sporulation lipoprotein [Neobacillus sp. YIM B06451]